MGFLRNNNSPLYWDPMTAATTRPRILIVGFGDVGQRLAPLLTLAFDVSVLVRCDAGETAAIALGCEPVRGDLADADSMSCLAGLADTIVHLAPPPATGIDDTHTSNLLNALARDKPASRFVYVSTTGVYGDCAGQWIDEARPLNPQTARARRRVDAERQIVDWAGNARASVTILRVPGIYAADRLPLARLQAGTPALIDAEDVYSNHIHADDLARCIVAATARVGPARVFNAVDDSDLKMGAYFDLVADRFGLPRPPRMTRAEVALRVSAAMLSFMSESRRIRNSRLKSELNVVLRYPTVATLLSEPIDLGETHPR